MNPHAILLRTIRWSGRIFGSILLLLASLFAVFVYPIYHVLPLDPTAALRLADATRSAFWLLTGFVAVIGVAFWLWSREVCRMVEAISATERDDRRRER